MASPSPVRLFLDSTGDMPEDALLGYIALSLGADAEHDREQLVKEFETRGLNTAHIPQLSRPVDAFKKAIQGWQDHKYPLSRTQEASILFREVDAPNPAEVTLRAVMREIRVDGVSGLSPFEQVGELKLYRPPRRGGVTDQSGARFSFSIHPAIQGPERQNLIALGAAVKADYDRHINALDGVKVRKLILDYMRIQLQAVALKDSVQFVPIAHVKELRELAGAISTLEKCRIDMVPLVDLHNQRGPVLEALQRETEHALGVLVKDLNKARAGKMRPATYAALRQRYDAIMAQSAHYAELLDSSMERTLGATDVAKSMLSALSREFLNPKEA